MGIFDEFKRLAHPYEDEDEDDYDDFDISPRPVERRDRDRDRYERPRRSSESTQMSRSPRLSCGSIIVIPPFTQYYTTHSIICQGDFSRQRPRGP